MFTYRSCCAAWAPGRGPAAAGALAYGLGGFLQLWVGWPLANTAALLPAVLYALVLTDRRGDRPSGRSGRSDRPVAGRRRDWALLVLATAALLLAGHPETIVYALLVTGAFAVARLRARPAGSRLPWAVRLVAASGLALALAAPALLPFAEILPETLRWSRLEAAQPTAQPLAAGSARRADFAPGADLRRAPATRLVQALAPNSFGNSRFVHYWGLRNSNEDAAGFVGTASVLAALMAALLALAGRLGGSPGAGRGSPLRHELLAFALVAAAAILLALPSGFPLLPGGPSAGPLRVPPGGLPGRLALVLDLGLAMAAAAGLERLRRAAPPRWLRWGGPAVLALGLAAFHLWAYSTLRSPDDPATLDVLRWGWVHWHLRFAALAAVLLALGAGRRWLAPALALLIGVELVLAHGSANPPMPPRLAFPSPPALAFLEHMPRPWRRARRSGRARSGRRARGGSRQSAPAQPGVGLSAVRRPGLQSAGAGALRPAAGAGDRLLGRGDPAARRPRPPAPLRPAGGPVAAPGPGGALPGRHRDRVRATPPAGSAAAPRPARWSPSAGRRRRASGRARGAPGGRRSCDPARQGTRPGARSAP